MKRIISIVFLVIPLLFLTYACGDETQATVAPKIQEVAPVENIQTFEQTQSVVENGAASVKVASEEELAVKPVAIAASHEEGAKLFKQNCAACHIGGGNLVAANKTLKKDALEKYNIYTKEAIVYQITNGKNAMPAFGERLSSGQIESLAEYVLAQADKDW